MDKFKWVIPHLKDFYNVEGCHGCGYSMEVYQNNAVSVYEIKVTLLVLNQVKGRPSDVRWVPRSGASRLLGNLPSEVAFIFSPRSKGGGR